MATRTTHRVVADTPWSDSPPQPGASTPIPVAASDRPRATLQPAASRGDAAGQQFTWLEAFLDVALVGVVLAIGFIVEGLVL